MERVNECISKLAFNFQTLWFLDVLYNINIEVMDKEKCPSPTACVAFKDFRISMYFNQEFIDKLSDDELLGVILHEVLHLSLYHNARNQDKHMQLWNIACDLEVNSIIKSLGFKLPKGCLYPTQFKLDTKLSAEMYYDQIYKEVQQNQKKYSKGGGISNDDLGQYGDAETLDDHSTWGQTEAERDLMKQVADQIVKSEIQKNIKDIDKSTFKDNITEGLKQSSENKIKMHGNSSGDFLSKISVTGNGKVKWNYILNKLIRRTLSSNYIPSFKRTSRRYGELVKGKIKNHKIDNIIVAVDTSGSIDRDLHERFMEEIILIRRMFKVEIRYIQCDTRVTQDIKLKRYTNIEDIPIKGGGGTDFNPVFDYIKEKHYKPNAILYFTDGYGDYPKHSNIDTLWVLSGEPGDCYEPPFGYKLYLEEKE